MIYTKPCGYGPCAMAIVEHEPARFARKRFHSRSCAIQARLAAGWRADQYLTPESRRRGALLGAKVLGEQRHRRALERAVRECETLIPAAFKREMSARDLAAIRVLLARAFEKGHSLGVRKTDIQRRRREQAEAA